MRKRAVTALALTLGLLLAACGRDAGSLAGKYAAAPGEKLPSPVCLVLAAEGKATLSMGAEDTSLRWSRSSPGEILLHTRDGGVLTARVLDSEMVLALPGDETVRLRKVPDSPPPGP